MRIPQTTPVNSPTPDKATLQFIPSGKAGTIATLKIMGQLVKDGKKMLPIRQLALSLVGANDQKDWTGEIKNLHAFVRDKIRYVRDVRGVETISTADKILESGQGDCDDKSVLLASLLESIGHPTRFVAIALGGPEFEHVYVETKLGSNWLALETTEPVNIGWSAPGVTSRLIYYN